MLKSWSKLEKILLFVSIMLVSTISVLASLFAIYLQIIRSRFCLSFYMINDVILMVLWGIPVISGNMILLPMVFNPIINFKNIIDAKQMGEKYLQRYHKHFKNPDIHEFDMKHEVWLYDDKWMKPVLKCIDYCMELKM